MEGEFEYSKGELKNIKDNCLLWANNCGGCETCTNVFGTKEPAYDHQETLNLVVMIEQRDLQIKRLQEQLIPTKRLLRRLFLAFKGWQWSDDEVPYYPMIELKKMFKKGKK